MNAYRQYQRTEPSTGWTRIDMLLALYDGALERLDRAASAVQSGETSLAVASVARAQLIVGELAAGVRIDDNREMGANMLRLYEFAANELRTPGLENIQRAHRILSTLREGFQSIRAEAIELERSGRLPPADRMQMISTRA